MPFLPSTAANYNTACPLAGERLWLLGVVDGLVKKHGVCKARLKVVQAFQAGEYTDIRRVHKLSVQTLRRWHKDRNGLASKSHLAGRKSVLSHDQLMLVVGMKANNPHLKWHMIAGDVPDADGDVPDADGVVPNADVVRRAYHAFKHENPAVVTRLEDPKKYRNKYKPAFGTQGYLATHVNALWELDSTPMDAEGSKASGGGRYALMAAIDVYSRRLIVKVARTGNAQGIKSLLRLSIMELGVPEIIKCDNGADYKSREVQAACAAVGFRQIFCLPGQPQQKPYIERALGVLNHDLAPRLSGFLGHSVVDQAARREREAQKAKKSNSAIAKLGRMFGAALDYGLNVEQLQAKIDEWCEERLDRPHDGLEGATPASRLANAEVRKIEDVRTLDILLADLGGKDGIRKVLHEGVSVHKGLYTASELGLWIGHKVRVKLDPIEVDTVHVFDLQWGYICAATNVKTQNLKRRVVAIKAKAVQDQEIKAVDDEIQAAVQKKKKIKRTDYAAQIISKHNQRPDSVAQLPMRVTGYAGGAVKAVQQATAPVKTERTGAEKYQDWLALDERDKAGQELDASERLFHKEFLSTPSGRAQLRKIHHWRTA